MSCTDQSESSIPESCVTMSANQTDCLHGCINCISTPAVMLYRWRCVSWVIPFNSPSRFFGCTSVTLKNSSHITQTTSRTTGLFYFYLQKTTDTTMHSYLSPPNLMNMVGQSGIRPQTDNQT